MRLKHSPIIKCWICGELDKISREHKIKKTNLKILREPTSKKPLHLTNFERKYKVKGRDADCLKSKAPMCAHCNNKRTQRSDKAWDVLSEFFQDKQIINAGQSINLGKIFKGSVKKNMLLVHLYFIKLFGCAVVEYRLSGIHISDFSTAIMNETAHPNFYIAFTDVPKNFPILLGYSNLEIERHTITGKIICAGMFIQYGNFAVRILFSDETEIRAGLLSSWHPTNINKILKIKKF